MMEEKIEIKRHGASLPLYIISVILTFVIYGLLIYFCKLSIENITINENLSEFLEEDRWVIEIIKCLGGIGVVVCVVLTVIYILFIVYDSRITALAYDIRVTENQFKELLDFEIDCAKKLGLKEIPKLYIETVGAEETRVDGAKFDNKHIIRINDVDVYSSIDEEYYAAKFTIARKLVSIYFGNYDVFFNILALYGNWIPILAQVNRRVMCYECDKGAILLMGKELVEKALILKNTGFYITPYINVDEFKKNLEDVLKEKNVVYENLMLEEPLLAYRIEAIEKDIDGRLF